MKKATAVISLAIFGLHLASCSTEQQEPEAAKDERHVWSDQTDTIDRAKGVEATIQKSAEEQRKALEAMEQ